MSIDIKWDTITSGPDGEALEEKIRAFVHDKFQQVTLPRFIRSVQVHSFDFGKTSPELEIKDICDPLPDFYEDEEEESESEDEDRADAIATPDIANEQNIRELQEQLRAKDQSQQSDARRPPSIRPPPNDPRLQALGSPFGLNSPFRSGTPGIPGGTSNMSYFHLPFGGISGTQTPLAAVASGSSFSHNWPDYSNENGIASRQSAFAYSPAVPPPASPSRPSTAVTVPPQSPESLVPTESHDSIHADVDGANEIGALDDGMELPKERGAEDIQIVCRVKYSGDVHMTLTAEILLDYPMPSFVGIPLKLSITGLKFDGVAILAYIRKRAHFCFLSPEDAQALVGTDNDDGNGAGGERSANKHVERRLGSLLQEIEVESEIGKKENGKQVLKNVSKVEKFVLEQVRRIFEEEFVFPSFWTFLV